MKKQFLIIPIIMLAMLFNCVIPAYADTETPNTMNLSSDEDLKEPEVGAKSFTDMSDSYYIWEHLTVKYTWSNGNWTRFIGIYSNGRDVPSFDFDPYITENLPIIGK